MSTCCNELLHASCDPCLRNAIAEVVVVREVAAIVIVATVARTVASVDITAATIDATVGTFHQGGEEDLATDAIGQTNTGRTGF